MAITILHISMIGIKSSYYEFGVYTSKTDPRYTSDLQDGTVECYKNVIFKDYLREDFVCMQDYMGCEYSFIGKLLVCPTEYMNELNSWCIGENEFIELKNDVEKELKCLGVKYNKDDIKIHSFLHSF